MKRRALVTCIAIVAAATAAVAQAQAGATPEAVRSFAWKGSPLHGEAEAHQMLRKRVDERLASAGYRAATGGAPNVYVVAHVAFRNPEDTDPGNGTLVVDLYDAATGVLIWRSFDSDLSAVSVAGARFPNVSTYAWKEMPVKPGAETPYGNTDRAIRNAIEAGLLFRDWTVAPDQASAFALVVYHLVVRGAEVKSPMKATMAVELISPWDNKLLWKGEEPVPVVKADKVEDTAIDAVIALAKQAPAASSAPAPK